MLSRHTPMAHDYSQFYTWASLLWRNVDIWSWCCYTGSVEMSCWSWRMTALSGCGWCLVFSFLLLSDRYVLLSTLAFGLSLVANSSHILDLRLIYFTLRLNDWLETGAGSFWTARLLLFVGSPCSARRRTFALRSHCYTFPVVKFGHHFLHSCFRLDQRFSPFMPQWFDSHYSYLDPPPILSTTVAPTF